MGDFLKEFQDCKKQKRTGNITANDIKAVFYFWNDSTISRTKLADKLHRSDSTLEKINKFIIEYGVPCFQDNNIDEVVFERIAEAYNGR